MADGLGDAGSALGDWLAIGLAVGVGVGLGEAVGAAVGVGVGAPVGAKVGALVGAAVAVEATGVPAGGEAWAIGPVHAARTAARSSSDGRVSERNGVIEAPIFERPEAHGAALRREGIKVH